MGVSERCSRCTGRGPETVGDDALATLDVRRRRAGRRALRSAWGKERSGLYSRIFNIDEQGGAAWLWSEALGVGGKRRLQVARAPALLPNVRQHGDFGGDGAHRIISGVYGICLGIDSHSVKKNK